MSVVGVVLEPSRETPVLTKCDVLVVGGGPAGCAAAAAAARIGAETVLVERYGHLGGMSTGGFVLWIDRMSDWSGRQVIAGFANDLLSRLPRTEIIGPPPAFWGSRDPEAVAYWEDRAAAWNGIVTWSPTVDPEHLKIAYSDLLAEHHVRLLLHCWAVAPVHEGSLIHGVAFESKSGRFAILAKVVVDATGDGDIFARAGADHESDTEDRDIHSTMNVAFRWGGVDAERYIRFRCQNPLEYRAVMALAAESFPADDSSTRGGGRGLLPWLTPRSDVVFFMGPRLFGYSAVNVEHLTAVEIESRKIMLRLLDFYRGNVPGFENAWVLDTASQIGVRHSRRIVGVKKVNREEWGAGVIHEDEIGVCPPPNPSNANVSVPLGCLVPAKLDNLLAAGRDLSCDATSHSFLREIPVCWMMGQAAGVAAAMAADAGLRVRDVDVKAVQRQLVSQGAYLRSQTKVP